MRAGRQEGVWKRRRCKQRAGKAQLWRLRAGHARGAHFKHPPHVTDAGRNKAQRLVERPRALPRKTGKHRGEGDMRASRREGGGWGGRWRKREGGLRL